ncbi:MAG: 3-dehydroquinate synthase II [Deltaproteobacteria bacterium]|nr:MAG: 3-dehydroquinate synthase II [Deltaproteobacteria bacterium]
MKTAWVKVDPWDKSLVTAALEGGAAAVMVPEGYHQKVKELGRITTIAPDGDLKPDEDVVFYEVTSHEDEKEILTQALSTRVVVRTTDWTIIPLENLVAQLDTIFTEVSNSDEAKAALTVLERGVAGVLIKTDNVAELKKILAIVRDQGEQVSLTTARVVSVQAAGLGDRVCVDTCTQMVEGQGMLVGNSSGALFLIHAESVENPYVAPRPFRVNAGPVHAYIRVPEGKTRYLSELVAGDQVLCVDHQEQAREVTVGRVKIERRPLLLVVAETETGTITTLVQNAETIRLTGPGGEPRSVATLVEGSEVLVALESPGRHFGHKVEETIWER